PAAKRVQRLVPHPLIRRTDNLTQPASHGICRLQIGAWNLDIFWSLVFGVWIFPFILPLARASPPSPTTPHPGPSLRTPTPTAPSAIRTSPRYRNAARAIPAPDTAPATLIDSTPASIARPGLRHSPRPPAIPSPSASARASRKSTDTFPP